jgi:ADP-ribose pyrophosphatase
MPGTASHLSDRDPSESALPEVISSELVLRSQLFDVVDDRLRLDDGREIASVSVEHPGAVAIVAIDDQERWLLVEQYRHGARKRLLEVPAGGREEGETPEATAAREIREETGFAADSIVRLGGAWSAPGFLTEYMHYFLATDLRPDPLPQDDDEDISAPLRMSYEQVLAAIDDGTIEDAKTIVAAMLWQRHDSAPAGRA